MARRLFTSVLGPEVEAYEPSDVAPPINFMGSTVEDGWRESSRTPRHASVGSCTNISWPTSRAPEPYVR